MEIFRSSRLRLTLVYSVVMGIFLVVLIFLVHVSMDWAMFSEQAQELSDAADEVAETQAYHIRHPSVTVDENRYYKNTNDRLFFYIFTPEGQLLDFVRAKTAVQVFDLPSESGRMINVMMTSKTIQVDDTEQIVYVGKDVTALYSGLRKATFMLIILGVIALIMLQ